MCVCLSQNFNHLSFTSRTDCGRWSDCAGRSRPRRGRPSPASRPSSGPAAGSSAASPPPSPGSTRSTSRRGSKDRYQSRAGIESRNSLGTWHLYLRRRSPNGCINPCRADKREEIQNRNFQNMWAGQRFQSLWCVLSTGQSSLFIVIKKLKRSIL